MTSSYLVPGWSWHLKDGCLGFGMQPMRRADVDTFQPLSSFWGRDANRVYVAGSEVHDADLATFQVLNPLYAKDARAVYTLKGPIKEADPATFEAVGPWEHFFNTTNGYAKDRNHVYHTIVGGKACVVKGANPASFTACGNGYGQDDISVFFERTKLAGAAPSEWEHIRGPHSRAGKDAYVLGRRIRGADGRRVESMPILDFAEYWVRDAKAYYRWDKRCDPEQYLDDFRLCFIFLGRVADISLTWNHTHKLAAEDARSWTIADHAWISVICKEWLQRPDLEVESVPCIGGTVGFADDALHLNLLYPPTWMAEDRIWILRADQELEVVPFWNEYSSLDHLGVIQSLIEASK